MPPVGFNVFLVTMQFKYFLICIYVTTVIKLGCKRAFLYIYLKFKHKSYKTFSYEFILSHYRGNLKLVKSIVLHGFSTSDSET